MDALLEREQVVDVVLEGGWKLTARLTNVSVDALDLTPMAGALGLPGQLDFCPATVAWRTRVGVTQRHGMLVRGEGGSLRLAPTNNPTPVQRRRFVRVPAVVATAVVVEDRRLLTKTVDLSLGGMLVSPADTLGLNEHVRFALDLGGATVSGDGEVVRGTAAGARGLRFARFDAFSERTLERFVAERQRELVQA